MDVLDVIITDPHFITLVVILTVMAIFAACEEVRQRKAQWAARRAVTEDELFARRLYDELMARAGSFRRATNAYDQHWRLPRNFFVGGITPAPSRARERVNWKKEGF